MTGFEDIGKKLHKIAAARQSDRQAKFDAQWQTISQYFFPQSSDINTQRTEGSLDWTQQIYDTQPIRAASTCAIGVRNWVTPATENWLGLAPPPNLMASSPAARNPRLARLAEPQGNPVDADGMDDATRWCAEVAEQLTEELQASRFYSVVQPFNKGACIFGTALMYCGEGKTSTFHFEQFKVGTFTIAENDQKIVDTVDRWFKLSLRQAAQRWGKKNLPSPRSMTRRPPTSTTSCRWRTSRSWAAPCPTTAGWAPRAWPSPRSIRTTTRRRSSRWEAMRRCPISACAGTHGEATTSPTVIRRPSRP
jgi:hypothetical protein